MGITSIAVRLMLGTAALAVLAVPVRAAPSYYAILESDTDSAGGQEVFAVTYDTFSDFLGDNQAGGSFSTLNINSAYSLGGFTYDGQYRLLLESNADSAGGQEVFAVTYDTIADLLADNQVGGSFSTLNINSAYSLGGFSSDFLPPGDGGGSVPEPPTSLLLLLALGVLRRIYRHGVSA